MILLILLAVCCADAPRESNGRAPVRFMTFNVEDVRTVDLIDHTHPRLRAAAAIVQELKPDVLLVNEIAYAYGSGQNAEGADPSANARRFADDFLAVAQAPGLSGIRYSVYQPATNTGVHSHMDLDNSGHQNLRYQIPEASDSMGSPPGQSEDGREYGNDSWGFGTFPGQYGMALFVREGAVILENEIRTWQQFRWSSLPGALEPEGVDGMRWYSEEEWPLLRLSSKNHAMVPIQFEDGRTVNVIVSHPTPPAFDGPERRNAMRNHDEIRLIRSIIDDEPFLIDDQGEVGGLEPGIPFVIMGDLNADPDEGSGFGNPVPNLLFSSGRINASFVPRADSDGVAMFPELDSDDTARFGLRVDYILPSEELEIVNGGVFRSRATREVSDHFPVWADISWIEN
jgi:endonuclease/exonuclease/phosphatase family metal-dependent hydrolase